MLRFLLSGATLGVAAGLSPGPLLALLVAQTLRCGLREGIKVSLAPVLTDLPIVTLSLLLLSRLSDLNPVLGWISIFGGLYVGWLGYESLRVRGAEVSAAGASPNSIRKAILVNFLNPHVYLFWMTVGAPMVLRAARTDLAWSAAFATGFYVCLCGSKMLIAVLINRSRDALTGRAYKWTVRAVGIVLLGFAVWLLRGGWQALR